MHFEAASDDADLLRLLMRLNSDQYLRTGSFDRFAIGWVVSLLERLLAYRGEDFGGMLSVLSSRGRLVAAHFGLRSPTDLALVVSGIRQGVRPLLAWPDLVGGDDARRGGSWVGANRPWPRRGV